MIVAPYVSGQGCDDLILGIVNNISYKLNEMQDDFLLLCAGTTGTGKSVLSLHILEHYLKKEASVNFLGLDKKDFAGALKKVKEKPLPRMCINDEANISKRESLTKYNKALIDLYMSIRGLRIFHWWNNPSLDIIDKHFIEERIKGVILIVSKDEKRPRIYYYFRKRDLLKVWEKYENLKLPLLKKIAKEYAYFRGWFKNYDGVLLKPYLEKKGARMDNKVDDFFELYGEPEDSLKPSQMCKLLEVSRGSYEIYFRELEKEGLLVEGKHYKRTPTNRILLDNKPEIIELFRSKQKYKRKNAEEAFKNGRDRYKNRNRTDVQETPVQEVQKQGYRYDKEFEILANYKPRKDS